MQTSERKKNAWHTVQKSDWTAITEAPQVKKDNSNDGSNSSWLLTWKQRTGNQVVTADYWLTGKGSSSKSINRNHWHTEKEILVNNSNTEKTQTHARTLTCMHTNTTPQNATCTQACACARTHSCTHTHTHTLTHMYTAYRSTEVI